MRLCKPLHMKFVLRYSSRARLTTRTALFSEVGTTAELVDSVEFITIPVHSPSVTYSGVRRSGYTCVRRPVVP